MKVRCQFLEKVTRITGQGKSVQYKCLLDESKCCGENCGKLKGGDK